MAGYVLIALIFVLVGIMILGSIADKRDREKAVEKDEKWLKDEMAKPRCYIQFVLVDGTVLTSATFDPYMDTPGSRWGYSMTSKQRASAVLESSYERGYFRDKNEVTYPACNVKQATVEA